ncbi:MAG: cache domain-containing protein [Rhodocyclales bacterium]|nr:cache domain-containing protein [Rhodocyclales bacterium]
MVLLPLAVVLPLLVAILTLWGGDAYDRLLIYKIRSDLAVADGYFERVKEGVGRGVQMLAASSRLARALADRDRPALSGFLEATKQSLRVDFLHFVDNRGTVLASSDLLPAGAVLEARPAVRGALEGRATTVLDIFEPDHLDAIHPDLKQRARVPIVATRNAVPTERQEEGRGMVIHTAAPVYDERGRLLGALVGGLLLNRNLEFVDRINEIIYPEGSLPFGSHGTATLFLDDVRIATNVRLFQDERAQERAIGTRVSATVRQAVLERGDTWLDRAFVVNDWYVSAYEPVADSEGRRVGMLYVGYLEAPFRAIKQWALAGVVFLFALAILLATVLSLKWARGIFRPLERMNETMNAIEAGDAAARVGGLASRDEIGQLAAHFDQLLDRLQAQTEALKRWGEELDGKVAERTRALEESNRSLREAQRRLVMSEKLAAIGELTAGVAHEINNPVAVIQGNLDVLREVLGQDAAPVREELRLMDKQVERIRLIVAKLLQFARPAEFAGYLEAVSPRAVFADCLVLVGHLLKRGNIAVVQQMETGRSVTINRNELQQVLINLTVNAIQAMAEGGTLTLAARDWNQDGQPPGVTLSVADTGRGIRPEDLDRIFDPFFSTKGQGGTGLGLSVSYGLVERYGGRITVDSAPGRGAIFTVWLLAEPELENMNAAAMPG